MMFAVEKCSGPACGSEEKWHKETNIYLYNGRRPGRSIYGAITQAESERKKGKGRRSARTSWRNYGYLHFLPVVLNGLRDASALRK